MKHKTDKLTTENPGMTENEIWGLVCAPFYGEYREELVDGLTEKHGENVVLDDGTTVAISTESSKFLPSQK
ncbi:LOW QUALITY PROTEIN: hypothetical protein PHMEG_00037794 [Phytophthora megakarya]|uniref:Uncharacterized protein n=1 Tax=Phytophthora megakarya TaxID=4795 RepID=A0A225UIT3_9STRA|nr:LOW QUALITY PROTEIN: hypothetical protein PHMEG_00037794 [Phytophthora megakarya]